jgi:hypothetical protein
MKKTSLCWLLLLCGIALSKREFNTTPTVLQFNKDRHHIIAFKPRKNTPFNDQPLNKINYFGWIQWGKTKFALVGVDDKPLKKIKTQTLIGFSHWTLEKITAKTLYLSHGKKTGELHIEKK